MLSRSSACWIALILVLTCGPARQVEAAADFARTMAEVDPGDRIEEKDGGVGDDSLEATLDEAPAADAAHQGEAGWDASPAWSSGVALGGLGVPTGSPVAAYPGWGVVPPGAARRQAWLGTFRF